MMQGAARLIYTCLAIMWALFACGPKGIEGGTFTPGYLGIAAVFALLAIAWRPDERGD